MFIVVLLFFIVIVWGGSIKPVKDVDEILSYNTTLPIRGICAIEIVLGHLGIAMSNQLILFPFRKAGILVVGIFFFLSGYGLLYNLERRDNYFKGFLQKRMNSIFIPVILVQIIYILLLSNSKMLETFGDLTFKSFFKSINWFVWEIVGFYFLFYLLYRGLKIYVATILLTFLCVIFVISCYALRISNPWYGSTFCFPLGIIVATQRNKVSQWCNKKIKIKLLVLSIILLGCFAVFFKLPEHNIIGAVFARNVASLIFVVIIVVVIEKVHLGNVVSYYLGKISYQIYLIHPLVILAYRSKLIYLHNDVLYAFVVIVTSVFLANIIYEIGSLMEKRLGKLTIFNSRGK